MVYCILYNMGNFVIKSVNLSPEEAKKVAELQKKGIKLRLLVRYGIEVAEQLEQLGKSYRNINEEIQDIIVRLRALSETVNAIVGFVPLFDKIKNELALFESNLKKLNAETITSVDTLKEHTDLYTDILRKINQQLSEVIKKAKIKNLEAIRQKINELDSLRLRIISKYNLPVEADEDLTKMGMVMAELKRLIRENDTDNN